MTRSAFNHRRQSIRISTDTFNRSPAFGTLASTDGNGAYDPQAWVAQAGTWTITSNKASVSSVGTGVKIATLNLHQVDVDFQALCAVVAVGGVTGGLVFRYTNLSNYLFAIKNAAGGTELWKRVAAVETQIGSTVAGTIGTDTLRVICAGSAISVYRNNVLKISQTDSFNAAATLYGLYMKNTNANSFDDWLASIA